ncbi:Tetratricopeptide repeat protein [Operophtera brumata]|uniref:Tetratricopeptide repeat protein n=1 Tax=Operophtera brumata TaxID=104452 RepID=A0A0L7L6P8_OPEBR|nr:Tetratricopeptide repeat protein [Operophtera brumata]
MINILSYVGMDMHWEVCLWTLLGLVRTIFDATLFRVNANLKQMSMPDALSLPVQRVLRTMISGVMLVQCFTVYVYLASYIVLLYPVFHYVGSGVADVDAGRPVLASAASATDHDLRRDAGAMLHGLRIPRLLHSAALPCVSATRKLLCELMSLALGLGTCVLLGPARPPCIKFVIVKLVSIMPAFYMWILMFGDHDYGLELAIRRRRTKSLLGEDQLRTNIVAGLYAERPVNSGNKSPNMDDMSSRVDNSPNTSLAEINTNADMFLTPASVISNRISESGSYEDWYGSDVVVPRDADRILEQFVLMILRIGAYLRKEGITSVDFDMIKTNSSGSVLSRHDNHANCTTIPSDDTDTPHFVGSSKGNTASYVREYPQIFMKKPPDPPRSSENKIAAGKTVHSRLEIDDNSNIVRSRKRAVSMSPKDKISVDIDKNINKGVASRNPQQNMHRDPDNQPRPSKPTAISRKKSSELKQNAINESKLKIKSDISLHEILSSNDSLRESINRITENKNNLNGGKETEDKENNDKVNEVKENVDKENEETSSSDTQKHEKKHKQQEK